MVSKRTETGTHISRSDRLAKDDGGRGGSAYHCRADRVLPMLNWEAHSTSAGKSVVEEVSCGRRRHVELERAKPRTAGTM